MPYSIKDLEQAGRAINAHFERRAEQRGEALARRMLQRTVEGRGLLGALFGCMVVPSALMLLMDLAGQ